MRDTAHIDSQNFPPRGCDTCGCPCFPMKCGELYLCDDCIHWRQIEADAKALVEREIA